jgi:MoaA/NifB/PqqE/SkfB family radical SAM enzyme
LWGSTHIWSGFRPRRIRPLVASLSLTENCQARCVTCDYWKTKWDNAISTARAVKMINDLACAGVKYLRFTGGEPLLRRDLFEILDGIEASRFRRITVQTNGLLLKKLYKQINESPITKVTISIDGLADRNDKIRGINGYFRLALEGAELLRVREIHIATTLTGPGADDLDGLLDLVEKKKWKFSFNLLDNRLYFFTYSEVGKVWPNRAATEAIVHVLKNRLNRPDYELGYISSYYRQGAAQDLSDEPPCAMGYVVLYITSNGDVRTGCYVLPPVGNVLQQDIGKILDSDEYRKRCAAMLRRECPGCTCGFLSNLKLQHSWSWAIHQLRISLKPKGRSIPLSPGNSAVQDGIRQ